MPPSWSYCSAPRISAPSSATQTWSSPTRSISCVIPGGHCRTSTVLAPMNPSKMRHTKAPVARRGSRPSRAYGRRRPGPPVSSPLWHFRRPIKRAHSCRRPRTSGELAPGNPSRRPLTARPTDIRSVKSPGPHRRLRRRGYRRDGGAQTCHHVLHAVSDVVIDVLLCGTDVAPGEAGKVAEQIPARWRNNAPASCRARRMVDRVLTWSGPRAKLLVGQTGSSGAG